MINSSVACFVRKNYWETRRYSPLKPDKGNNKKNTFGLITLILWALVLTLLFRSCSASYASANEVQVDYSTFKQWVEEDKVERVLMQSGK